MESALVIVVKDMMRWAYASSRIDVHASIVTRSTRDPAAPRGELLRDFPHDNSRFCEGHDGGYHLVFHW